jgi:hypothetical protein
MDFRRFFRADNRLGESTREKTGSEGETLRGAEAHFADFLGSCGAEVRFYGSVAGWRRQDRPNDWPVGNASDWNGEGIRDGG